MKSCLLVPFLLLPLAPAAWASDCSVARFNFVFGSDTEASMVTKSGTRCVSKITARTAVESSKIAQNPASGSAFIVDSHAWGYQSRPGFKGDDAFVVELSGTSYRKGASGSIPLTGSTRINVAVHVVP